MVPHPENLENHFSGIPSSNIMLHWMSRMSANLCPFRAFFNSGKRQNHRGLSQVNKVDGLFLQCIS
jgi:hypothetical protein